MKPILEQLLDNQNLARDDAFSIMLSIMSGEYNDAQIAGFLMALRSKGETVDEITGFAQAMREKMVKVPLETPATDHPEPGSPFQSPSQSKITYSEPGSTGEEGSTP